MILISIETSGRKGSVALCRGGTDSFDTLKMAALDGGIYSELLISTISGLLAGNKLDKSAADAFVVVNGPGSFTGLRVGLATAKGLCEALGKPLVTVSMLAAVAIQHGKAGKVTVALDAGRGELYVGEYRVSGDAELIREYIVKLAEWQCDEGTVLTPDEKLAGALRAGGIGVALVDRVHADDVGRIGLRKLLAGDVADVATADVNYIRRSDAELFVKPKI